MSRIMPGRNDFSGWLHTALATAVAVMLCVPATAAEPGTELLLASEIKWDQLNPARGDKSPRAGTLWGDRAGTGPTGFLVQFVDGFSSPPHIHNVSYRGIVLDGLIHNDDPGAASMWMPPGSYWTQPAGEIHITAAQGDRNVAYIEIDSGPYLVLPLDEAFDNGERPVNVDAANIVWQDARSTNRIEGGGDAADGNVAELAFLWGRPGADSLQGTLVRLPPGFDGAIRSDGADFRAVVIAGRPAYHVVAEYAPRSLDPGSYFGSKGESVHKLTCPPGESCTLYTRSSGGIRVLGAAGS